MNRIEAEKELCMIIKKTNALEFGAFKLSSGRTTPYYLDLRVIPSFPEAFHRVVDILRDAIIEDLGVDSFDRISGIPSAGLPFASLIAYHLNKPFLYTRQNIRLRGRERRVEGILMPGDRVLLVDDLVTTGLSLRRAASAIRAEGGVVSDAYVILDREEGGCKRLENAGIKLHCIIKISSVAETLYEIGAVDEDQLKILLKQVRK
ncbi:MAG: orotate phosphoribosyltransferase [Nitrososphaerota archaeon]|nr:orotate phosphoribosyltransferase [Candidatus Bathyarchaeota archaeon]MDW8049267.1 orotate phosphoribosyltransferase [Nitrososphaerota archaeon]